MSEETAVQTSTPQGRSRWWTVLLVVSLALNLLVAGAIAVKFLSPDRYERFVGSGYSPLVPRSFIRDLPDDRGKEIGDMLRSNRSEFRASFAEMRKAAGTFADALDHQPYDENAVIAAIDSYGKVGMGMIDRGSRITADIVRKLTPEERSLLAQRVRERASRRK